MMVTEVRGAFKDVHGTLEFDPDDPASSRVEVTIDANGVWSGEAGRDEHLRSADFLDVENHPTITFEGDQMEVAGASDYEVTGNLTIRGVTQAVTLRVRQLGQWNTPWWVGDEDKGPKLRTGFIARTEINRHDFGVSWNSTLDKGGLVVGDTVHITIDAEAVLDD
jgi:polyisoprenoid-binding protein YceI